MHQVFTTGDAAEYLRLSPQFLAKLRVQGGGPRFVKLGRSVRYRRADLDEYLATNERQNTAQ